MVVRRKYSRPVGADDIALGDTIAEKTDNLEKFLGETNAQLEKELEDGLPALASIKVDIELEKAKYLEGTKNITFEYDLFNCWYACGRSATKTAEALIKTYAERKSDLLEYFVHPQVFSEFWNRGDPGVQRMKLSVRDKVTNLVTLKEWDKRANEIDAEVKARQDKNLVNRRVEMLNRHVDLGKLLQEQGKNFLETSGIDNARDAIRAIEKGVEMERISEGMPTNVIQVMSLPDEELIRKYKSLRGDVVEGQFSEVKSLPEPEKENTEDA